ncbi:unnamed protein product [Pieris brassicae]|uniref:Uncharacterized protein n=1 Tax=Pieris brassicae TaxID=7116 RepID=A0A9P0TMN5_PIEBR|nr:unnamed protein product [Pieris brassicae]
MLENASQKQVERDPRSHLFAVKKYSKILKGRKALLVSIKYNNNRTAVGNRVVDDSEGSEECTDDEVYSQGTHQEELSLSLKGTFGSDFSIFDTTSRSKTTSRRPRAADIPARED